MKRIIDKKTGLFLRDDFTFDELIEIGLDVEPAQGLYKPKWDGSQWIEGATQEYIDSITQQPIQEQTLEERVKNVEQEQEAIITVLSDIMEVWYE